MIVGLGETDEELVDLFYGLKDEQIAAYLFSFNPEPGTVMQDVDRAPIHRTRRIQLTKHLIENEGLPREAVGFDDEGAIVRLDAPGVDVDTVTQSGVPFMTDGCPSRTGEVACNRPYGSYRPGEEVRDYPFQPTAPDVAIIEEQMRLHEVRGHGEPV